MGKSSSSGLKVIKKVTQALLSGDSSGCAEFLVELERDDLSRDVEELLLATLSDPALPLEVLNEATRTNWWEALVAITKNPEVSADQLERIASAMQGGQWHNEVQEAILLSANLTVDLKGKLLLGLPPMWSHLTAEEIERRESALTRAGDGGTLGALAASRGQVELSKSIFRKHWGAPPSGATKPYTYFEVMEDNQRRNVNELGLRQQEKFANHPLTSRETLWSLSWLEDEVIDVRIAGNPSTPPFVVGRYAEWLYSDLEPVNLAWGNPVLPAYMWSLIPNIVNKSSLSFEEEIILSGAAMNHGAPIAIMACLATSAHKSVKAELRRNPCLPKDLKVAR